MIQINQVYYWRYKSKPHEHCNNLQHKLKQKVFTKVIKMTSLEVQVHRPRSLIKSTVKREWFNLSVSREVGVEVNINNQSKSLSYKLNGFSNYKVFSDIPWLQLLWQLDPEPLLGCLPRHCQLKKPSTYINLHLAKYWEAPWLSLILE